jgi:hypothetical protein
MMTNPQLLGLNPDTIQRNAEALQGLGLTKAKIATLAHLLGRDPDTIQGNAEALQALGLTRAKIATNAALLGRHRETIQRNYRFLRNLMPKDVISNFGQMLGNSQTTVEGSVQYLYGLGVDHERYPYVLTTSTCKRRKVNTLLRVRYGLTDCLPLSERKKLYEKAKAFIRSQPRILTMSTKKIRERFARAA